MGLFAQTNIFYRLFAIRRGDRVGRPLCAEGPPKRHCQFDSKSAQRHLSPSRTHQTKGCTKFTENPHRYRPIYTHDSAGRPRGDPYGLLAQTNIFYRLFAIRRGDRVGRPLCAEGPPKRHCQFDSKSAQRHLSPSRTHQTKGCTKFTENPHRYRPIYTHDSAGRPRGDPYGLLAQTNIFYRLFAIRRGDRVGRPLCAEGPPKRHCQFDSKSAQRHLNPKWHRCGGEPVS